MVTQSKKDLIYTAYNTATKPHAAYYRDCQRNPETNALGLAATLGPIKPKKK